MKSSGNILYHIQPSMLSSSSDLAMKAYNAVTNREPASISHPSVSRSCSSRISKPTVTWESETTRTEALLKMCRKFSKQKVTTETINRLKESTKQLLFLVEEIQSKAHCKNLKKQKKTTMTHCTVTDPLDLKKIISVKEIELLQKQMKESDKGDCKDDCSVYKRLTRKCNCLTEPKYNDFVIQFNDDEPSSRCITSSVGEIIKNVKILKKFIYMGGEYTQNALDFLNVGLEESNFTETVNILMGISHADVCNVFADLSVVAVCIALPVDAAHYGDKITQYLAAKLVHRISKVEEGRRYLNYSTKICDDIKRLLNQAAASLEYDTLEELNAALGNLQPPLTDILNVSYFCTPLYEGSSNDTINALMNYRQYMSMDEVFTHLAVVHKMSKTDTGKDELSPKLPMLLQLLRRMVLEYDNNDINVLFVNILNNIIAHQKRPDPVKHHVLTVDPKVRVMKSECMQYPPPRPAPPLKHKSYKKLKSNSSRPRPTSAETSTAARLYQGTYLSEASAQRWMAALKRTKETALLATSVLEDRENITRRL